MYCFTVCSFNSFLCWTFNLSNSRPLDSYSKISFYLFFWLSFRIVLLGSVRQPIGIFRWHLNQLIILTSLFGHTESVWLGIWCVPLYTQIILCILEWSCMFHCYFYRTYYLRLCRILNRAWFSAVLLLVHFWNVGGSRTFKAVRPICLIAFRPLIDRLWGLSVNVVSECCSWGFQCQ